MTQPNIPHLTQLAEWLEAGAPHAYFSMELGICPATDEGIFDNCCSATLEELFWHTNELDKPACGTVCCIAGAAQLMSIAPDGQIFPSQKAQDEFMAAGKGSWLKTQIDALNYLGLEMGDAYDHPLFDMRRAPSPCSPAQAAVAVRRVIAGKEPWTTS